MGIPKKGSRKIDVDGKGFRFLVREKKIPDFEDLKLSVTVQEEADKPGRCFQFDWPHGHFVTPEDVKVAVRDAMKAGWDPWSRGGVFTLLER